MGRPKEFDPKDAATEAMHLFWAKGYHDTSIRDLVERTGVNYYGLYSVFDDKRGLFLAALDRYRDTVTAEILGELSKPGPALTGVRRAFHRAADLTKSQDGHAGCLMCNTAAELASHDADVAAKVQANLTRLRDGFRAALTRAQNEGDLSEDKNVTALAEFLAATLYTLSLLTRAGVGPAYVKRHAHTALSLLE